MSRLHERGSRPRVLSIAGTDPTGGAGIHADLKSIAAMGGYGMAVVTALVAQNTQGVRSIHTPPVAFLREQLLAVSDDVTIDAVKIGMLGDAQVTQVVAEWLDQVRPPFVVLDPVMVASSGDRLLEAEAEAAVRDLARQADVITPNLPELEVLTGGVAVAGPRHAEDYLPVAAEFARTSGAAVVVKGGHAVGETLVDYLVTGDGAAPAAFSAPRIHTRHTHGTGCSLSAALATVGAREGSLTDAFAVVHPWLHGAIERGAALRVGRGNGPIDHGWRQG